MFDRWRDEVARTRVKQEIKQESKFAARALGVKPRKVIAVYRTDDGEGLAVYFFAPVQRRNTVWLQRVGFDGLLYGAHKEFPLGWAATEHQLSEGWRDL